jgi:hypothetical protein
VEIKDILYNGSLNDKEECFCHRGSDTWVQPYWFGHTNSAIAISHRDSDTWVQKQGFGHRDVATGVQIKGFGHRGSDTGIWPQGFGHRGSDTGFSHSHQPQEFSHIHQPHVLVTGIQPSATWVQPQVLAKSFMNGDSATGSSHSDSAH